MIKLKSDNFFPWLGNLLFDNKGIVLAIIVAVTGYFLWHIPAVKMLSDFSDLLPQNHPYINLHNEIRDDFGGANIINVMVEVDEGTIFTNETLDRIHRITQAVDSLHDVNHNLVTSLTHRNSRKVELTADGNIESPPFYDPQKESYTQEELNEMKRDVVSSGHVYGFLVSPDLKAAVIKATLLEGELDYSKVFKQLQEIRTTEQAPGITIYATGQPVLVGWVSSYSPQIIQIFLYTILIVLAILIFYMRRLYGILLPILGMTLTSIWGIGFMGAFGYNLDPLMLVVPFLVSARSLSHGIQKVERYYLELQHTNDKHIAVRNTFNSLFRPGGLAIVADAAALFLIGLGSVPINDKMAIYASFWALSMIVTVLVTLPLLLSILPQPKHVDIKHTIARDIFPKISRLTATRNRSLVVLFSCIVIVTGALYFSSWVQVGEPEPGSPLLYEEHDYNVSSKVINQKFPGSEELFIVARTNKKNGIKRPEVMHALNDFQAYMMLDSNLGGTYGINNLVAQVNKMIRNDDPAWYLIPGNEREIGGVMYTYMMSSPVPGALSKYVDPDDQIANIIFYYKDRTGETIRRAIYMAKEWSENVASNIDNFELDLAGGPVGVTAAINEEAYETNVIVVPAVLALIFLFTLWFYNSVHAALITLMAMTFATIITYGFMGIFGLGLNVNTVPMIALGIGLGVDYAIYMMDRIKEEYKHSDSIEEAIRRSVGTTGLAIALTASTLVGGIIMWVVLSDLRFQADSARLLITMLLINACGGMLLVPAWVMIFKPKFITEVNRSAPSDNGEYVSVCSGGHNKYDSMEVDNSGIYADLN